MNMVEIWKDIEGYEGLYEVSNQGRVRSLNYNKTGKVKELKPKNNGNGYLIAQLYKCGKIKYFLIHRLVAKAFLEDWSMWFPEVNHKDEDKTNNSVDNLEWCSTKYNNNYGTRLDRVRQTRIKNGFSDPKRCFLTKKECQHLWYLDNKERVIAKSKNRYQEHKKNLS